MAGLRNFIVINDLLTQNQLDRLYKEGCPERYVWNYNGENQDIDRVRSNKLLSVVNLENANNVDFIYCKTNQTTETIKPEVFS
jgi:hypothetical protein